MYSQSEQFNLILGPFANPAIPLKKKTAAGQVLFAGGKIYLQEVRKVVWHYLHKITTTTHKAMIGNNCI